MGSHILYVADQETNERFALMLSLHQVETQ